MSVAKIDRLLNKIESLDNDLEQYAEILMESHEVDVLMSELNVKQMNAGYNADNTRIEPAYAIRTVEIKRKKGQQADFVTLRDKGDFQGAIRVRAANGKAEVLSEDSKSEELQNKYGEKIFGLNTYHLSVVKDFLKPNFLNFVRNYIKNK